MESDEYMGIYRNAKMQKGMEWDGVEGGPRPPPPQMFNAFVHLFAQRHV